MLEHSRRKYRNTLTMEFAWAFHNDHNSISDDVQQNGSAGSQIMSFHSAKSRDFFLNAHAEFIRKRHFHVPLFALTLFAHAKSHHK